MLDPLSRFQYAADRSAMGLFTLVRIVVVILVVLFRHPKWVLWAIFFAWLFGAVLNLNYGWMLPIAVLFLLMAFFLFRRRRR